jgi:uncharacterized membrane protein
MKPLQKPDHLTVQSSECGFLRRLSLRLKPEVVFLYFALVFGLSLLVTVPPFQAPDEQHHFFRAYQVSEGIMVGKHFRVEYLPKSLKYAWEVTSRAMPGHPDRKITPANIVSAFQISLDPNDRSFIASFAAPYSPHFYFPQVLGLTLGRGLGLSPMALLYLGRLCTLVFCIWIFYWSIRKTPVLKWVFCLLAATPINMSLAASCSQDAVINGLAFLFTASVLDLALSPEKRLTARSVLFPAIVGALLAPAKGGAYAPMLAFLLFIPVRKAASLTRYLGLVTFATIPAVITFASWTLASQHQLLPIFDSASTDFGGSNRITLLSGIWQDSMHYLWLVAKTTTGLYKGYVAQFIGVLGWLDTFLPRSIIIAYLALVFTAAIAEDAPGKGVSVPSKILVGSVVIFVYVYILTTQYLTFSPHSSPVIHGLQGRYLIPLGPAFFLLFHKWRQIFRLRYISLFPLVIVAFMLVVIPITLLTAVNRFYGQEQATWKMSFDLRTAQDSRSHVALTSSGGFHQTFVCPLDSLTGVSVLIVNSGLPAGKVVSGYRLVLRDAASGEVVREVGIEPFIFEHRLYLDIVFDPILDSKNKKYTFTIFPTDRAAKMSISLPLSEPSLYPEGETIVHGRQTDRSVVFELIFRSPAKPDT